MWLNGKCGAKWRTGERERPTGEFIETARFKPDSNQMGDVTDAFLSHGTRTNFS